MKSSAQYRADDDTLGIRPSAAAIAAAQAAVSARAPFRFMMTGVKTTDDTIRTVPGKTRGDVWFQDAPYEEAEREEAAAKEADEGTAVTSVLLFGRREDGPSVCVRVDGFKPWFRVEVPNGWSEMEQHKLMAALNERFKTDPGRSIVHTNDYRKRYYGWIPDAKEPWRTRRFRYMNLAFPNIQVAQRAARLLQGHAASWVGGELRFVKLPDDVALVAELERGMTIVKARDALKAVPLSGSRRELLLRAYLRQRGYIGFLLADTLQKAATHFCNGLALVPSEWVTVANYGPTTDTDARIANCDVEVATTAAPHCLFPALDDVTFHAGSHTYTATRHLLAWAHAYIDAGIVPQPATAVEDQPPLLLSKSVRDWRAKPGTTPEVDAAVRKWDPQPLTALGPMVVASFDCEMYSHNDSFPSVDKGDSTKYIGTNFRVGSGPIVRVMQCVGKVVKPAYTSTSPGDGGYDPSVNIHVECYNSEQELYEAWRDLVVSLDPDVLLSWNGFGFDFPFMHADYMQCFATVSERCTEGMQLALRRKARDMLQEHGVPVPVETFDTCPELLVRLRSMLGWKDMVNMLTAMAKEHGSKFVKNLLAAEKLVKTTHKLLYTKNILTALGLDGTEGLTTTAAIPQVQSAAILAHVSGALDAAEDEEDDASEHEHDSDASSDSGDGSDQGSSGNDPTAPRFADVDDTATSATVYMSPLSELAAVEVRQELRKRLHDEAVTYAETHASYSKYVTEALAMKQKEHMRSLPALMEDLERVGAKAAFLAWVASQRCLGPGIVRLLTMPVLPADSLQRGLYLSRMAAEACPLFEKKMNSAAKGDNVYDYYQMTGRTPVDLMQIIKDDKKPEDNSLRYAAEQWLDAAKKLEADNVDSSVRADKARALLKQKGRNAMKAAGAAVLGNKRTRDDGSAAKHDHEHKMRRAVGSGRAAAFLDSLGDTRELSNDMLAAQSAVREAMAWRPPVQRKTTAKTTVAGAQEDTAMGNALPLELGDLPAASNSKPDAKGTPTTGNDKKNGDKSKAKIDLSAVDMFRLYRQGEADPVKRWLIVEYCARDCDIPLLLVDKLKYMTIWTEMSRVCFTPLEQVVNAGQQVKVFNLIARFVHGEFAVNVRDSGWPSNEAHNDEEPHDDGGRDRKSDYQGATVIEPCKGFYKWAISTLDFASLYPSIIRFFNLCPSALVADDEYKAWDKNPACHGKVTLEQHKITHNVLVSWRTVPGKTKREPVYKEETRTYTFVTHIQGVLPRLLSHLGRCRKIAKKAMEAAESKAAELKSTAAFLQGVAWSGPESAAAAAKELDAVKAGGKPKAGQLRSLQLGLQAGGCTVAGIAKARANLLAVVEDTKRKLSSESNDDAARKMHGAVLEAEAFDVALAQVVAAADGPAAINATIKEVKAAAAAADQEAAVQNGRQLGIKVSMNSVYGFNGVSADKGILPCKPVAAVTTLKGRAFIEVAQNYVEKTYPGSKVIYGDTDSVMILWGREMSVEEAYRLGGEAAKAITGVLRGGLVAGLGGAGYEAHVAKAKADDDDNAADKSPKRDLEEACNAVELTNEKVYMPYLLDKKKRYAGLKWAMNEETGEFVAKLDMKGIVRRDIPKFARDTIEKILHALLYDKSVDKAHGVLSSILEDILADRMPMSAFIMSKSVRGSYKGGVENLPQVQAWRRMQQRGDDGIPPIGARMPYLVVAPSNGADGGKGCDVKLYERSEHPAHVRAASLPLDLVYYIEQLEKPVSKLVEHVGMKGVSMLFAAAVDRANAKINGLRSLLDFMVADGNGNGDEDDDGFSVLLPDEGVRMAKPSKPVPTFKPKPVNKPSKPAAKTKSGNNLLTMLGIE